VSTKSKTKLFDYQRESELSSVVRSSLTSVSDSENSFMDEPRSEFSLFIRKLFLLVDDSRISVDGVTRNSFDENRDDSDSAMALTNSQESFRSDSSRVGCRWTILGPDFDLKLFLVSEFVQACRILVKGLIGLGSIDLLPFLRIEIVLRTFLLTNGLHMGIGLSSLSPSLLELLWLDSTASRAATRAALARAISRHSLPKVLLRSAGGGGANDLLELFQADRLELSSGPAKRTPVFLLVAGVGIMVEVCFIWNIQYTLVETKIVFVFQQKS